jgi:hypothetical protein
VNRLGGSTTNSTGSSPGAAAGARPGIAFSSGSAGRLGLSSGYALHTIDRLDHPDVNIKRFRRNRGSHIGEPVGKAEPAASAGPWCRQLIVVDRKIRNRPHCDPNSHSAFGSR